MLNYKKEGNMKLYDIISNLKFIGIKNYKDQDIESLSCNSDEKVFNGIYFCIKGFSRDGHKYACESVKNGNVCLVVENYVDLDVTQILVEDVRVAMSHISSIFYSTYKSKMKFVGITGTNGKTTTTFIIREILQKLGKKVGLIGTQGVFINNLMLPSKLTTPDPIDLHKLISDMENNGCEYCVMEVSAHSIALNKIDDINYSIVGLTNITEDHLDFFLNMENYSNCKLSLFDSKHAQMGIVNSADKYAKKLREQTNISLFSFGKNGELQLESQQTTLKGSYFKLKYQNKTFTGQTNLVGEYNLMNLLLAISCLLCLGFDLKEILAVVKYNKITVPGRFNLLKIDADFSVLVDYAHTPDGMKNILKTVKSFAPKRIITVFGCGGNRDKQKRPIMGQIANSLSDVVIVTTDNPRDENPELIIEDITKGLNSNKIEKITDRKSAIEHALDIATKQDVVVILGKGAEQYQEIKGIKFSYNDFDVVDNYFKSKIKDEIKA